MLQRPGGRWLKHVLTQRDFIHGNKCLLHTGICWDTLRGDFYQQAPARAASECRRWLCVAVGARGRIRGESRTQNAVAGSQLWSTLTRAGGKRIFIMCFKKISYKSSRNSQCLVARSVEREGRMHSCSSEGET